MEVVSEEVAAAAGGRVAGMAPLLRAGEEELRAKAAELKVRSSTPYVNVCVQGAWSGRLSDGRWV